MSALTSSLSSWGSFCSGLAVVSSGWSALGPFVADVPSFAGGFIPSFGGSSCGFGFGLLMIGLHVDHNDWHYNHSETVNACTTLSTILIYQEPTHLCQFICRKILNVAKTFHLQRLFFFCKLRFCKYTVFEKNVITFSMISWTRTVHLQRFLAHLLLRLHAIDRYFSWCQTWIRLFTVLLLQVNVMSILSASDLIPCSNYCVLLTVKYF